MIALYRVYIVDDEWMIVDNLINGLPWQDNGFEIAGSNTNPFDAIAEIHDIKPDIVFCDLKMPGMDGLKVISLVKEQGNDCEFVMLSAHAEFNASRDFYRMGGFDYLLKPLNEQDAELLLEKLSRKISVKLGNHSSLMLKKTNMQAFDNMIDYIVKNYDKKHSLKKLSTQFNISQSHICGLFSKHYGISLSVFLTDIRMKEASKLIIKTDRAIKTIAVECGYSDYFYFFKVFKGYWGVSPTEYRKTN